MFQKNLTENEIYISYDLDNITNRFIPTFKHQSTIVVNNQTNLVFSVKTYNYNKNFNTWELYDEFVEYFSKK